MKALDYDGLDHVVDKIYDLVNSGGSADYIVEEGTIGIWTYRKWASGIAEAWGETGMKTVDITSQQGGIYLTNEITETYPSDIFQTIKTVNVNKSSYNSNSGVFGTAWNTETHTIRYSIFRGNSGGSNQVSVSIYIKGLWKEFTPSVSVGHIDLVGYDVVTGTNPITIPATNSWRFAVISAYVNTGSYVATYQTIITNNQTFSNAVLLLGGYDIGGNDFGLCNVNINMNVNGGTMTLRNFYYAGQNFKSGANLGIRYYGTK